MVPTTLGVVVVIFTLFHVTPGDPALLMGGGSEQRSAEVDGGARAAKFRRKHGLDRAFLVQLCDYIGPFNLDRDGHPWFHSPYTERKVETFELPVSGGEGLTRVVEGRAQAIDQLPSTTEALATALDAACSVLADDGAGKGAWLGAASELMEAGEASLPALMTGLHALQADLPAAQARLARFSATLRSATDHEPQVHPAREEALGSHALVRHWFGWYYTNGGARVRNTGERPWGGLLTLDLRGEMQTGYPVATELRKRLAVTVPLTLVSVLLSFLIAIPLGLFSVQRQGTRLDGCVSTVLYGLFAIPTFWAGLMLILLFGKTGLDWLPVLGLHDKDASEMGGIAYAWDTAKHAILPIVTLTYGSLAYLSRQMRAGLLEVVRADYIRTARAKGLSDRTVLVRHALRNGALPVLTLMASVLPVLIGGSIIVETVFDIPGMGLYAYKGLFARDYHIILATTLLVAILTQVGILLSDLAYRIVDPRIRHE